MAATKASIPLATKLQRISERSKSDINNKFDKLMPLFSKANLIQCFCELKEDRATGVDKLTKESYEEKLEANIEDLIERMKRLEYRPKPVKEVFIPKADGGLRPLGISSIEDKIIQNMYAKILGAIFEPYFLDCSYGFRPGRKCHQAIHKVHDYLFKHPSNWVIDADIKNYFGTIDHAQLLEFIQTRITDKVFLRYLSRMLKAGILSPEGFRITDEGSPQGAICSPVLSNIYAHFVLDIWFEKEVKARCPDTELVRYADDFVIGCSNSTTANRIHQVLEKRLDKYNLTLHKDKTKVVQMSKSEFRRGKKQGTFNFLGFTSYLGKSRTGKIIPKVQTDSKRFSSKQRKVKEWMKAQRDQPFLETWKSLNRRLQGHVNYYGVSHNSEKVSNFIYQSHKTFFKWMNRRSQRRSLTWKQFNIFKDCNPGVKPSIKYQLFPGYVKRMM